MDLARLLLAKLPGLNVTEAVLRVAGPPKVPSRKKAQFSRAHAEGAVLYVLRESLGQPTRIGDLQSFAKALKLTKTELETQAKGLSNSKSDAVAAALSALPRRRSGLRTDHNEFAEFRDLPAVAALNEGMEHHTH